MLSKHTDEQSCQQHLPALRILVALGGGAQLGQARLVAHSRLGLGLGSGLGLGLGLELGLALGLAAHLRGGRHEPQEAAGVRAHAEDITVAHDAMASLCRDATASLCRVAMASLSTVGIERGGVAGVRGLAAVPLEALGRP